MSEFVERCFVAFQDDHDDLELRKDDLISAIASKTLTPLQFVEALEEGLNSRDTRKRSKATELIAEVIESIVLILSDEEQLHFARFFTTKFKDWSCLLGGLQGSLHLLNQSFPKAELFFIISDAFFEFLELQSLKVSQRFIALKILSLLIKSGGVLLERDSRLDLIEKTIGSIEGEKDPKCLSLVFQLIQDLVELYSQSREDLSTLTEASEELFEVIACYFPINDHEVPDSESWDQNPLIRELNEALSCTSLFSEFCFSLILDKLNSDHQFAKLNSLLLLRTCANRFPFDSFVEYLSSIWISIKSVVFGIDQDVLIKENAILTLQSLCQMSPEGHPEWTTMVDLVFQEERVLDVVVLLKNEDFESEQDLGMMISVIEKIAWLNDQTIEKTIVCILEPVLASLKDFMKKGQNFQLLTRNLKFFLRLMDKLNLNLKTNEIKEIIGRRIEAFQKLTDWIKSLNTFLSTLLLVSLEPSVCLLELLMPLKMHICALNGFLEVFSELEFTQEVNQVFKEIFIKGNLNISDELQVNLKSCYELMISSSETSIVKSQFSQLSVHLSLAYLLPLEIFTLDQEMEIETQDYPFVLLKNERIESSAAKTIQIQLLEVLVNYSTTNGVLILKSSAEMLTKWIQQSQENPSKQGALAVILHFLRIRVFVKEDLMDEDSNRISSMILSSLLEAIKNAPRFLDGLNAYLNKELLCLFCKLVQCSDVTYQQKIIDEIMKTTPFPVEFKLGAVCGITNFQEITSYPALTYEVLEGCLNQNDDLDPSLKAFTIAHVLQTSQVEESGVERVLKGIDCSKSLITNLLYNCLILRGILAGSYSYSNCSGAASELLTKTNQSFESYLKQQDNSQEVLIGRIFESLISEKLTFGFDGCLEWKSPLQRQRAFSICLEVILSILKSNSTSINSPLIIMGYIIIGAKTELVKMEWKRVIPWIIQLVDLLQTGIPQSHQFLVQVVEILSELLKEAKSTDSIKEQRNEVLRSLLQISKYQESAEVRVIGIKTLSESPQWLLRSSDEVELFLPQIMNVLKIALDDKKRRVRKAAVKCKTKLSALKKL